MGPPKAFPRFRLLDLQVEYALFSQTGKDALERLERRTPVPVEIVKWVRTPEDIDWEI